MIKQFFYFATGRNQPPPRDDEQVIQTKPTTFRTKKGVNERDTQVEL